MLTLTALTVRLGGHTVLDDASAAIPWRSRVGIVGRNGAGKSTLLRLIAGEIEVDGGSIDWPRDTRLGYLAQEAPGGDTTPIAAVLAADEERAQLLAEAEAAHQPHRIAEIEERLATIGAHAAPARAARILAGLGFDEAMQNGPLAALSGGWRMRVALASVLFAAPDLLLLDEPTNHLDLEAALWLESFLANYRGTLLVVSHDRDLLNNAVDNILHLEAGKLALYHGGYDEFVRQRAERREQQAAARAAQDAKRQKLQAYIDRWRYKAHTARQAQSRMKALAKLEDVPAPIEQAGLSMEFPSPDDLRPPLVTLDRASVGYGGKPVLSRLDLRIDPDDRIAFLGRNGNGKTTLARLLARDLTPMAGEMTASSRLRVGYFAQHTVEALVPDETPIQHMSRALPDAAPERVRAQLGRFGFSGDKATIAVGNLSGGERARLALALITRDAPHLVILDEPTNHLDIDAREALVDALNEYGGAVIVISHDHHLLELTADRLILVADGTAKAFDGELDDYRALVLSEGAERRESSSSSSRKEGRRAAAAQRERTQPLRQAVNKAEAEIAALEKKRSTIERELADPARWQNGKAGDTAQMMKSRAEIERLIAAAEERWVAASEALERAMAEAQEPGTDTA